MKKCRIYLFTSFLLLIVIIIAQGINLRDALEEENQLDTQYQEVPRLASNNFSKIVGKDLSLSIDKLRLDGSEEQTPYTMVKPKIASNGPINVACVFAVGGLGDNSFNDMAYAGLNKALIEGLCTFDYSEPSDISEYQTFLDDYASSGSYDLIVTVGFAQKTAVNNVSTYYPNQAIALIDEIVDQGNVSSLVFKEEEGSFLAGAMASLMTNTGRMGFIGGMDLPLIRKFWAGFAAGAFYEKNNSYIEVIENFVGAWDNQTTAKSMAEDMWVKGVDIIYAAAGGSGLGVLESANEQGEGFFAIGVDVDQDYLFPGRILTSMMKRFDIAVYNAIKDVYDSTWSPDIQLLGLEENGVGLSPLTYTKDEIGSDIIQEVNVTLRNKIINDEITVPTNVSNLEQWLIDMNIVKNSFTPRGSIVITSNSQFEALFDGSGTLTDPYLIEGYYINDTSGPSISIHGTTAYFRISDNILNGLSTTNYGIDLQNVDNGIITNNTIYSTNGNGINSLECSDINITDNFIHTNSKGIYLNNSNHMILLKNIIFNNTFGLEINNTLNNTITNNRIYNNNHDAIRMWYSNNITIDSNTIYNTGASGLSINTAYDIKVLNNQFYENNYALHTYLFNESLISGNIIYNHSNQGMRFWTCITNTIFNNTIDNIGEDGIGLHSEANNNSIINNTISSCDLMGIRIEESVDNRIINNTAINNSEDGLWLGNSNLSYIEGNKITENGYSSNPGGNGIFLNQSDDNIISNNTVFNNSLNGIYLYGSDNNTISNNEVFYNHEDGIALNTSDENRLLNNTVHHNGLNPGGNGIFLDPSNHNTIANNTIYSNGEHGIFLQNSAYNDIEENNITANGYSGNPGGNGIFLDPSDNNTIINNYVFNNSLNGIYLYDSENNTLFDNEVSYNHEDGVALNASDDNRVLNNSIHHNGLNPGGNGIFLDPSNRNIIANNTIYSNGEHGIFLQHSTYNHIEGNNITANGYSGNPGGNGIFLDPSDNNTIINNYVFN
ncbi:MAG: right-handed parallel beta-helix repeat-containing protein, partial [Promethearchaeota archaeon]